MAMNRRMVVKSLGAALAAPFVRVGPVRAAPVTMRLHHALPAADSLHASFLIPWAASIREASGGELDIQMLPAMQLGGTARQLSRQVRDGVVDMAWLALDDAPGEFPRMEVFHLPFVAARSAAINSQAAQEIAGRHAVAEFAGVQPLIVAAQDQAVLHTTRAVAAADIRGFRLRPPTALAGEALQALGAIPVQVRDAHLAEALEQSVLDGCVAPWSEAPTALQEAAAFRTEMAQSPSFLTAIYLLLMNKARFDALPEAARNALLGRSGLEGARLAGLAFDARSGRIMASAQERGGTTIQLAPEEQARWTEATRPAVAAWVERVRARGVDGTALLAEARVLFAEYEPPALAAPAAAPAPPAPAVQSGQPAPQPDTLQPGTLQPPSAQPAPVQPAPLQPVPLQPGTLQPTAP